MSSSEFASGSSTIYAVAVQEVGGCALSFHENADEPIETMSAIKSPIGTLALEQAASDGHDIATYTLEVRPEHYSNGSGRLREHDVFHSDDAEHKTLVIGLDEILYSNIVESDCVATNVLIDYLGGKDNINAALRCNLGVESMELVTDRIHFTGVDHKMKPFQVGRASMRSLMDYYQTIWSPDSRWTPRSPGYDWYQEIHNRVNAAILFNSKRSKLPGDITWYRKSGSALEITRQNFYGTLVEAGMLCSQGRRLFVAAGITEINDVPLCGDEKELFKENFAAKNIRSLGICNVGIEQQTALAA